MAPDPWIDPVLALVGLALVLIPGAGVVGVLTRPGQLRPAAGLALTCAFGYASLLSIGFLLALAHALTVATVLVCWVTSVAAIWLIGRRRIASVAATLRREIADDRWPFLIGVAALATFIVARALHPPVLNLGATPLRYWADGVQIADLGHFPSLVLQWNRLLPPATSKIGLSSFYAPMSLLLGKEAFPSLAVLLTVSAVSLFTVAWGLLDSLGMRWLAPAGALWLCGNTSWGHQRFSQDLGRALAENWGRMAALSAVILAVVAIREAVRDPALEAEAGPRRHRWAGLAVVSGAMLGIAAVTHLVPTAVAAGTIVLYAMATAVFERRGAALAWVAARLAATTLLLFGLVLAFAPGQLGFDAAAGDQAYQRIRDRYGFPQEWDPTLYLTQGRLQQPARVAYGPAEVWGDFRHLAISGRDHEGRPPWLEWAPFVVAGLGAGLVFAFGDRQLRIGGVTFLLLGVLLLAVAMLFAIRFDTLVLAHFGARRLADYWGLPFLVLTAGGLETIVRRASAALAGRRDEGRHREAGGRGRPASVVPAGIAVGTLALAVVLLPAQVRGWDEQRTSNERNLGALAWIASRVPCEGRILADRRTLATFEALTGHAGVLEGMGPHLRPDVLDLAVGELLEAEAFFDAPTQSYLQERGVGAVVLTSSAADLGGWIHLRRASSPTEEGFDDVAFLTLAHRDGDTAVYSVTPFVATPGLPSVDAQPGFDCLVNGS